MAMRKVLILGAALTLTACAGASQQDTPQTAPAVSPETVKVTPPPAPPPKPKITAQQLLGQMGPWVRSKLGEPVFVRAEKTANIWQYKNGHCVLNLFLYAEGTADSASRVLHFDARDAHGANTDRNTCLASLQD